jgi:hypothetical protein
VTIGNAAVDGAAYRGWFVGHFLPNATTEVEIKWGVHRKGEVRAAWATSRQATSMSLLVRGAIRLFFTRDGEAPSEALLAEPGDYAVWPPGVAHRWRIEGDETIIVTVRWPSVAGDAVDLAP